MLHVLSAPNRHRRQSGQAIVEGALVLLVALSIIIFVLDMGRLMLMQQFITERARVTARAAAVNNWSATSVKNYFLFNSTTAPNGATSGFLGLTASEVAYTTLGTLGNPDYRVQITVSNVPLLMFVPYIAGTYTAPTVIATMPAQSLGATN